LTQNLTPSLHRSNFIALFGITFLQENERSSSLHCPLAKNIYYLLETVYGQAHPATVPLHTLSIPSSYPWGQYSAFVDTISKINFYDHVDNVSTANSDASESSKEDKLVPAATQTLKLTMPMIITRIIYTQKTELLPKQPHAFLLIDDNTSLVSFLSGFLLWIGTTLLLLFLALPRAILFSSMVMMLESLPNLSISLEKSVLWLTLAIISISVILSGYGRSWPRRVGD